MIEQFTVLVDGDIVCYRCAAACENEDESIAKWQVDQMMERIIRETNATHHKAFLTGGNFRYAIYPEYKANRRDTVKPKWLEPLREHLITQWNATLTIDIEADDALGIEQVKMRKEAGLF